MFYIDYCLFHSILFILSMPCLVSFLSTRSASCSLEKAYKELRALFYYGIKVVLQLVFIYFRLITCNNNKGN